MEKLRIYRTGLDLTVDVYKLTSNHPKVKSDYPLSDQLRRASVSIVANIAEGYCRSKRQFRNYLHIASGSANESVALLQIIHRVHRVDTERLQESFRILGKQINAFSKALTDN